MLNFKKRLWIIKQKQKGELTDSEIAISQRITRRAVQKIWSGYQNEGISFLQDKTVGRKPTETPEHILTQILNLRRQNHGIRSIQGLLEQQEIHVSIKRIHNELKKRNLVIQEPKKGRRYHYIKWERQHSNSLWQTDYCWQESQQCWLTAWLDDHSRLITASDYVTEATTENALRIFERGVRKFVLPRETLSDRDTQYYAVLGETSSF